MIKQNEAPIASAFDILSMPVLSEEPGTPVPVVPPPERTKPKAPPPFRQPTPPGPAPSPDVDPGHCPAHEPGPCKF